MAAPQALGQQSGVSVGASLPPGRVGTRGCHSSSPGLQSALLRSKLTDNRGLSGAL